MTRLRIHWLRRCRAFSLLEVVASLGIFSFCIVIILVLLGSLTHSSRESWMETRSAHIVHQIMQDLRPVPSVSSSVTTQATAEHGLLVKDDGVVQVPLLPDQAWSEKVTYDIEGQPVGKTEPEALFEAEISVVPLVMETAATGQAERRLAQVTIKVLPITQPDTEPFTFVTRITPLSVPDLP